MSDDFLKYWKISEHPFWSLKHDFYIPQSWADTIPILISTLEQPYTISRVQGSQGVGASSFSKLVLQGAQGYPSHKIYVSPHYAKSLTEVISFHVLGSGQSLDMDSLQRLNAVLFRTKSHLRIVVDCGEFAQVQEADLCIFYASWIFVEKKEALKSSVCVNLNPFSSVELKMYWNHKTSSAGLHSKVFGDEVIAKIYEKSGGNLHIANSLGEISLMLASRDQASSVLIKHIEDALKFINQSPLKNQFESPQNHGEIAPSLSSLFAE